MGDVGMAEGDPIVVTAIYGGYDKPKIPPPGKAPRVLFSEDERLWAPGWDVVGRAGILPHRHMAKVPKCVPHVVGIEEDDVVWIDGSFATTGKGLQELVGQVPKGGVGAFLHPHRVTVREEMLASVTLRPYRNEPLNQQVQHYERSLPSVDALSPVWACGIVVWRGAQRTMGLRWLAEIFAWTTQDQVSFSWAAAQAGVKVTSLLGGDIFRNRWFTYHPHARNEY